MIETNELFKSLRAPFDLTDIEWKIGQAGKKRDGSIWAKCLAYISARAIQDRLDQTVGPENWKPEYHFLPGDAKVSPGVICRLSLRIGGEWITKEDGAEQTDFESFKGGLSSALKRAGSAWGIGRYLYGLEADFAHIVDQNTKGARYGQLKEEGGPKTPYHWLPPELPEWALPEGYKKDPAPKAAPAPAIPKVNPQVTQSSPAPQQASLGIPTPGVEPAKKPSEAQMKRLFAIATENGWTGDDIGAHCKEHFGIGGKHELTLTSYNAMVNFIQMNPNAPFGDMPG